MPLRSHESIWTIPARNYSHFGDIDDHKNVLLNPPQIWGFFRLKKTLSSDRFGLIEHLAWLSSPKLDFGYAPHVPMIHSNYVKQKSKSLWWHWRPRTGRLTPLRHGDFRPRNHFTFTLRVITGFRVTLRQKWRNSFTPPSVKPSKVKEGFPRKIQPTHRGTYCTRWYCIVCYN